MYMLYFEDTGEFLARCDSKLKAMTWAAAWSRECNRPIAGIANRSLGATISCFRYEKGKSSIEEDCYANAFASRSRRAFNSGKNPGTADGGSIERNRADIPVRVATREKELEFLCVYVDKAGRPAGGKAFFVPTIDKALARGAVLANARGAAGYEIWNNETRVAAVGVALKL
jgi:hypothetical protein